MPIERLICSVQQLSEHQRKRAMAKFDLIILTYAKALCNKIFC